MTTKELPKSLRDILDNFPEDIKAMYADFIVLSPFPGSDEDRLARAAFIFAANEVHKYYQKMLRRLERDNYSND